MNVLEITVCPEKTPGPPNNYYPTMVVTKGDSTAGFSMVHSPLYSGNLSFSKSEITTD